MKAKLNEEGYIIAYALIGDIEGSIDIPSDNIPSNFFSDAWHHFKYEGSLLTEDPTYFSEIDKQNMEMKKSLCLQKVFNSGDVIMSMLLLLRLNQAEFDLKYEELNAWKTAWELATETHVEPTAPTWILEILDK